MTNIINTITLLNIGFSIVIAMVLFVSYLFFLKSPNKTPASVIACGSFLAVIIALQLEHLNFLVHRADPLESTYFRGLLFIIPPLFYFLSRYVLFPNYRAKWLSLFHFVPFISVFFITSEIVVPIAFVIGTGYCIWLTKIIFNLKQHRNRFEVEFFFFVFFSLFAFAVLIAGFSASFIDNAYFYHFYANGIAFAFMLVTGALVIYPDLLNELTEVVKLSYTTSTLSKIDIEKNLADLEKLMVESKIYQNEDLSLSSLAEAMSLSTHQLSELINTHYAMNFSKYIAALRVEQAKLLLKDEPASSVLSISLQTGFKSQSNFYAAFKSVVGVSPGNYRKNLTHS